jgi:hypothetical protein
MKRTALLAVFVVACASPRAVRPVPTASANRAPGDANVAQSCSNPVPAIPPNGVPPELFTESNFVVGVPGVQGKVMRNVVMIRFRASTDSASRAAVIHELCGRVVGGERLFAHGDGDYFVRLPLPENGAGLASALSKVKMNPVVAVAMPYRVIGIKY